MQKEKQLTFASFRLDTINECLWRGKQGIKLTTKAFAVLRYLVEHPGQLVTKDDLFKAVWPGIYVSDAALAVCIGEIRKVLGDDPKAPRLIETAHRRGYRFIGRIKGAKQLGLETRQSRRETRNTLLVGREAELAQMQRWLEKALRGERQVVFVTGEAGIGKTTVVEAFLERAAADGGLWVGRGQCIEHYGAGEAYLPVLEALGRLCRKPGDKRLIELLDQQAPTWLVQMPSLLSAAELDTLQRKTLGATREKMLREMAEAVEALTSEKPLVLVVEDLQWSDHSTLELISSLARRREEARLLMLGTYRPVEVVVSGHPLKALRQELQMHGQCEEMPLECLTEAAVGEYLAVRFAVGAHAPLRELARVVHQRTDGNPLFMVNVVGYLVAQGLVVEVDERWELKKGLEEVEVGVPESLRQMIEKQIDGLNPEEQRVLEVASVAGAEFSAAAVAAGLEEEVVQVEERCEGLVRRDQFLRSRGTVEWPEGTAAACYGFIHALYQEVLYGRVTAGRRIGLHRRIGEREEAAYGKQVREIAVELAVHFERGRDYRRAVHYLQQAGENATRRSAHVEAISLLSKGLELLKTLPHTPERTEQELLLLTTLGPALMVTKGYAAPEVESAYTRARALCQQVGATPQLFPVLLGLWGFSLLRAELQTARALGEQCLHLAQSVQGPTFLVQAHFALGITLLWLGELVPARVHLEQGITLYDSQKRRSHAFRAVQDPGVGCRSYVAWALGFLGYPDQARKRSHEALTLAQELSHPFSQAFALAFAAILYQCLQEVHATQERAEAAMALCTEREFAFYLAMGTNLRGWALAEQGQGEEGIGQIHQGLVAHQATGAKLGRPHYLALLAEAYGNVEQTEEGLRVLTEALAAVDKTGERYYEAELYRIKGTLILQSQVQGPKSKVQKSSESGVRSPESEAEECFLKAIEIARCQSAKSWELRAAMSLSRLWQSQGKREEARQMLAEIYGWFTEGFDTKDLQEAKALLEELQG